MAGKRKIYTPEEKQEILARLEASGLGVTAFAQQEGVSHGSLIAWRNGKKAPSKAKKVKGRTGPADPKMRIMAVEAYRKAGIPAREFAKTWELCGKPVEFFLSGPRFFTQLLSIRQAALPPSQALRCLRAPER